MMRILTYTWSPLMLLELWWCLASASIHPLRVLVWTNRLIVAKVVLAILLEPLKRLASASRALFLSHPSIRAMITSRCSFANPSQRTSCPNHLLQQHERSCWTIHPSDDPTMLVLTLATILACRSSSRCRWKSSPWRWRCHNRKARCKQAWGRDKGERARDEKMKCDHIERELASEWLRVCALFVPCNVCDW